MDTGKIKNFIIIVLIITNVFLLASFGVRYSRASEFRRTANEELAKLYDSHNISLPEGLDAFDIAPSGLGLTRDLESERKMAESILGKCSMTEQGGNIYVYLGAKGQASFRGTGEFEMLLEYEAVEISRGKLHTARSVLETMGIKYGGFEEEITDGDRHTITLDCKYELSDVYNVRVNFLFYGDNLMLIYGKRVFDSETERSQVQTINAGTALVRFLKESSDRGYVCTVVTRVSSGYSMTVAVSGDCILTPVWHIETDTGNYIINAETGRLETMAY